MLAFLDVFFFVFHTALIVFVLIGWAHPKTRPWNLAVQLLTLFSWVGLGYFYGWGYCICTDWHWQVREAMGRPMHTTSYTVFLVEATLPVNVSRLFMEGMTTAGLIIAFAISLTLNIRDWRRKRRNATAPQPQH